MTRREQDRELAILRERKRADDAAIAEVLGGPIAHLSPVDPCDVFVISGYVANASRGTRKLDNVFCVDSRLYADIATVGLEAFDPNQVKTYRWTIEERNVGGCDVEVASLREVEFVRGRYEETGEGF